MADESERPLTQSRDQAVGKVKMPERVAEAGKQESDSHQSPAQRHQDPRPEAIEGKSDERGSHSVNQKIHRRDAGAVAVRPTKVLQ